MSSASIADEILSRPVSPAERDTLGNTKRRRRNRRGKTRVRRLYYASLKSRARTHEPVFRSVVSELGKHEREVEGEIGNRGENRRLIFVRSVRESVRSAGILGFVRTRPIFVSYRLSLFVHITYLSYILLSIFCIMIIELSVLHLT